MVLIIETDEFDVSCEQSESIRVQVFDAVVDGTRMLPQLNFKFVFNTS